MHFKFTGHEIIGMSLVKDENYTQICIHTFIYIYI